MGKSKGRSDTPPKKSGPRRARSAALAPLKVLCVHGVGQHPPGGEWETRWRTAIEFAWGQAGGAGAPDVKYVYLDAIFDAYPIQWWHTLTAAAKLVGSGLAAPFRSARGAGGGVRWTAGMVVQWVENPDLRKDTRQALFKSIEAEEPHLILAHSLGSLVAYDTFTLPATAGVLQDRTFVSFGSQIGNAFVAGSFSAGRIQPLGQALHWYHLFNRHDDIFTAEIRLTHDRFTQVPTPFNIAGFADHDGPTYLSDGAAIQGFWADYALRRSRPQLFRSLAAAAAATAGTPAPAPAPSIETVASWASVPRRRALLIGINDYPKPEMRLGGCVNDTFLVSSVLQEAGFESENIRVVLNDRATAAGIRERLEWLLEGAGKDAVRLLYFSGHGVQLPTYGLGDQIDRMDEALVPWDFDWSPERAITDDQFYELYSQLDYSCAFVAVFDCCHSGGLTRGGAPRVRGLNPPDDIRHRALRWDRERQLWVTRKNLAEAPTDVAAMLATLPAPTTAGSKAAPRALQARLGYCGRMRTLDDTDYKSRCRELNHSGPYKPVLVYACQEHEFAYEYDHGATPHGAFTFVMAKSLRRATAENKKITWPKLVELAAAELKNELQLAQQPKVEGPSDWLAQPIKFGD